MSGKKGRWMGLAKGVGSVLRKVRRRFRDGLRLASRGQKENLERYRQERECRGVIAAAKPLVISVVSTGRCNMACDMCVTHSRRIPADRRWAQNPTKDMDVETFREVLDRFPEAAQVHIIGGGEPLLNPDFFSLVELGAGRGMAVKTFSNGVALGPSIARLLDSPLHTLTVSINGHAPEEFARMTGMDPGMYGAILMNVGRLTAARDRRLSPLVVNASFILDKTNYVHVPAMLETAFGLGVDGVHLVSFLPSPCDGYRVEERTITTDDAAIVGFLRRAVPAGLRRRVSLPTVLDRGASAKRCSCHWAQVRVNGNGEVSSCSMMLLNMAGHGTIRDGSAMEVWNSAWFQGMRAKFLSEGKDALELPCTVCVDNFGVSPWDDESDALTDRVSS
ncbi:MAG: radical SAM protein [Elusimicrobia bacterium]|nr:radical SAM protein [Elusimicrobiota bacterium]